MTGSIDNVFGGEEILLIFGLFIALMIVVDGIDKLLWTDKKGSGNQKVTASKTEIEEKSESNDKVVKLLTMPSYFAAGLDDKERRPLLFEMCGTISDTAIMETDDELREELLPLLNGNTVEDYRKMSVSQHGLTADVGKTLPNNRRKLRRQHRPLMTITTPQIPTSTGGADNGRYKRL